MTSQLRHCETVIFHVHSRHVHAVEIDSMAELLPKEKGGREGKAKEKRRKKVK